MAPVSSASQADPNLDELHSYGLGGRAAPLVIVSFVMFFVALLLVGNRLVCRMTLKKPLGMDDYVIALSLVFCAATIGVILIGVNYGYGRRKDTISAINLSTSLKMFWILQIFCKCTINTTKLSVLLLYRKIFDTNRFKFRTVCSVLFAAIVLHTVAATIATIVECLPVHRVWDMTVEGTCINLTIFWHINAAFNVVADFMIFFLPLPIINTLSLPLRSKIGMMAIFALGAFVCATTVIRLTTLKGSAETKDQNYGTLSSTLWTIVESATGIICSCLPMLRIPLSRVFPGFFTINWYNDNAKYVRSFPLMCIDLREWKADAGGIEGEQSPSSGGHSRLTFSPNPQTSGALSPVEVVISVDPSGRGFLQNSTGNRDPIHQILPETPSTLRREMDCSRPNSPALPVVPELAHLAAKERELSRSKTSYSSKRAGVQFDSASSLSKAPKRPPPIIMPPRLSSSPLSAHSRRSPSSFIPSPRRPQHIRRVASPPLPASPLSPHNTRVTSPASSLIELERAQARPDRSRRFAYRPPTSLPAATPPPVSQPPALRESPTIPEAIALPPSRGSTPVSTPAPTPAPTHPPAVPPKSSRR